MDALSRAEQPVQRQRQGDPGRAFGGSEESWLAGRSSRSQFRPVQAKSLQVRPAGDRYEQEADRIADQVVAVAGGSSGPARQGPAASGSLGAQVSPLIQRDSEGGKGGGFQASSRFQRQLDGARSGGTPLDGNTRSLMEGQFQRDFSQVRLHTGGTAASLNQQIGSRAFTQGSHIFLRGGRQQGTAEDTRLIAHELTHVAQQTDSGAVQAMPAIQCDGTPLAPIPEEQEVDVHPGPVRLPTIKEEEEDDEEEDDEEDVADVFDFGLIADEDIAYDKDSSDLFKRPVTLRKAKALYRTQNKSKSQKLGMLAANSSIKIISSPEQSGTRMWATIEATVNGQRAMGYINTHFGIKGGELTHKSHEGAVMSQDGPKPEHVLQGMHGDCFLLAALMGLARSRPGDITSGVFQTDPRQPQANHKLRFYTIPKPSDQDQSQHAETVTVSNKLLTMTRDVKKTDNTVMAKGSRYGAQGDEAWPAVIEKAFAAWPHRPETEKLAGGHGHKALMILTGEAHSHDSIHSAGTKDALDRMRADPSKYPDLDDDKAVSAVIEEMNLERRPDHKRALIAMAARHEAATVATNQKPSAAWTQRCGEATGQGSSGEMKVGGIAHKHVYELVAADNDVIKLRNPWGKYSRVNGQVDQNAAISVLTWEEFFEVASDYSLKS